MLYFILIAIAVSKDANLTIGLDFSDNSYLDFFSSFSKHYDEFHQNGLKVNIVQHLLPCYSCYKRHQFKQPEKNCLGGGRYCQYSDYASGQVILKELLRQQCVLQVLPNHYFNYTIYFGQQCKKSTMVNCAQTYFSNNNISTEGIDTCVENSFEEGEEVNQEIRTNKILNQYKELQYNQTSFSVHLDSSDITNTPYDEFLSTMCSKYINISISFCKNIEKPNKQTDNGNTLEQVFLFFFALIILILTASGGWTLLSKIQFGSSLVPKSRIAIPKLEGDHIIQEDDI
ncbi:unnamed protein product (macronuclear) [Paramecium tetraurelia]|uniref:Vacuolar sorting receptor thioredoxin-like domain-containing protein n=1 Tax=Paramecium tetraurelia TaxID=5888 RepID=A0BYV8_PARTE|nr:uncharacterized protein GSPATT00033578001 [Paramecium tetraurelia]CAK63725.1 unnamed protein product [Paramecium tetraurelia]|eukprot:XP_001431123.1 hypothetical protein (macronuclear) [Paramecium tetraurelia strain d4-2]